MWTIEGLKKIFGLWGASSWIDGSHLAFPFPWLTEATSAASGAAETVTAASGATEAAAQTATQVVSFGFNYSYGEQPAMVIEKMPDWFASIMQIMIPNVEVAHLMQKVMSFVELAIGLAIMAGFLTWIVNAVTIGLVATFCLSGMFYWVNMWFVPAAIALMNGSGRAFGLDYYVIPWFQRTAGSWWYGKSKAIYGFDKQGNQLVK
jgi:pyridine nucleotide-disulfide family oxidoreductase